ELARRLQRKLISQDSAILRTILLKGESPAAQECGGRRPRSVEDISVMIAIPPQLHSELERRGLARTYHRVRNLALELGAGQVTWRGEAASFHVKQLAQHGVREMLPDVALVNAIVVG